MTREFAAPAQLVFDAWTKPELLQRWLGVRAGWTMPVCEVDLRVGGKYRWVWRKDSKGIEMTVRGVYQEIVAPERIVCTESFDDPWYPGEALDTYTFEENDGKTISKITMRFESKEGRDGVLASPMDQGVEESYVVLDGLLAELG
jgi:uncharacterized protein YndB with AHSA1/START domain